MESKAKYNPPNPLKGEHEVKNPPFRGQGGFKDKDMQSIIGWILRAGVITSMVVVFIGGILYVYRHGNSIADYHVFKAVPYFTHNKGINGAFSFNGQDIIQWGIILLIATPIIRVAFSAIGFIIEKDHLYTALTVIVLLIILGSMLSGQIG